MLRIRIALLVFFIMFVAATQANAVTVFTANLTNSRENPPTNPTTSTGGVRPASFGTVTFVLNDARTALPFIANVFNIDFTGTQTSDTKDNLTATNDVPVVWGFVGSPFNGNRPNEFAVTPLALLPEPAPVILLGVGILIVAFFCRRGLRKR